MIVSVLILAAGSGSRMGASVPKQFLKIGSDTILALSTKAFIENDSVDNIIVVVPDAYVEEVSKSMAGLNKNHRVLAGGSSRLESGRLGLRGLEGLSEEDHLVLIHDGARPYVSQALINRLIEAGWKYGATIPGIPLVDTVRNTLAGSEEGPLESGENLIESGGILDRESLRAIQTPQAFPYKVIKKAYEQDFQVTDDASLLEKAGERVYILEGDVRNKKITTVEDLPVMNTRIGIGHDTHRLIEGRDLILGGVRVDHDKGLDGHSDADVLTHALMDAILGALALGDIGEHFPDTDENYAGISSMALLEKVMDLIGGYRLVNLDAIIFAEKPKLLPYMDKIRESISEATGLDIGSVSIKATTGEGLGYIGRQEGISAQAVVLIEKI